MRYRKFKADKLFNGFEMISQGQVLITDEQGKIEGIVPEQEAGDAIEVFQGTLSPGFINCHCHLELSHMRGSIPVKTGMIDFILSVVQDRNSPEEEIFDAIEKAEAEMVRNGIVAVGDICNNLHTLPQKSRSNLHYYNFIEASGFHPSIADIRFERARNIYTEFMNRNTAHSPGPGSELPYWLNSIVPHAPYSLSKELFHKISQFDSGRVITMHNQESAAEEELFQQGSGPFMALYREMKIDASFFKPSGKTSLQTVIQDLDNNKNVILVHNVTTQESDIAFLKQTPGFGGHSSNKSNLFFCLCFNANLYIDNGLPSLPLLIQSGYPLVLGTDSLASNHQLSILAEMNTIRQYFPVTDAASLLSWATMNGARALQMDELLGSFESGKRPGVILIDDQWERCTRLL